MARDAFPRRSRGFQRTTICIVRRNLILLDDNILAYSGAGDLLEEMAARDLKVCFSQTLDLRLVDQEMARLLKRIACSNLRFTRRAYHFSLNDCCNLDAVGRKYRMFGFANRDNVEFIFMYGFGTTLDEFIRIVFRQTMKSFENYYRWVSMRYVETFGKLHQGLVDTIFRYNNRRQRGHHMAGMARLKRPEPAGCSQCVERRDT
jgi:hypothetical protein